MSSAPADPRRALARSSLPSECMDDLWTIVLAGGEGRRLAPLTKQLYGFALPKQFAVLDGERSLLQRTIERWLPLSPPERTVVVLPRAHEEIGRAQLAEWPALHVVSQPRNRGTAAGLLLGLAYVLERAPDAFVCVSPADHHFDIESEARRAVTCARAAAAEHPIVLVGAAATSGETEYGWIVRGPSTGACAHVRGFIEKPDREAAARLMRAGALWNTFLLVARAQTLWDRAALRLPVHATAIRHCRPIASTRTRGELSEAYDRLPARDLSRDVLQNENALAVVELTPCGWSDLGSPERVREVMHWRGEADPTPTPLDGRSCG